MFLYSQVSFFVLLGNSVFELREACEKLGEGRGVGLSCLGPGPQTESDEVFQCVPCWLLFPSEEELIQHRQSTCCGQRDPIPGGTASTQPAAAPRPSASAPKQQNLTQTGPSPDVTEQNRSKTQPAASLLILCDPQGQSQVVTPGPEQPAPRSHGKGGPGSGSASQIQFQCGDCGCLFESLALWLQHRKLSECRQTAPEPGGETQRESEGVGAGAGAEQGPADGGVAEAPPQGAQSAEAEKEPTDSQSAQEDGQMNRDERPQKAGGRTKKSVAAPCRSFLCGECGAGFNWQPALVAHRRTEHSLEGALHQCLECGESFMNTALFVLHCKKHRDWLAKKPRAERKRSLQQRVENGDREKEIIRKRPSKRRLKAKTPSSALEPGSESAAARKPRRRRGAGSQECPQCGRTFSNPRYLRAHVLSHSGHKQFRCEICDKTFTYQNNLRRHHLLHTGERPYMCDRCGKTFTQSSHLKDHLRNHDRAYWWSRPRGRGAREWADVGPKLPHPCPDCPRSFMTHAQLLMHRKMCPICERTFKWRGSLPAHIVRHTDNKLFSCELCGKTFSYQTNLARHLIIHAGTRPYACRHCGKTFNQSSNLRQHLVVHAKAGTRHQATEREDGVEAGEPEAQLLHACPECPVTFKTMSQLQKHRCSHPGQDSFLCSVCGVEPCKCQQQEDQGSASYQDAESLSCLRCSAPFDNQEALEAHAQSCAAADEGGRSRPNRRGRRRRSAQQMECDMCGRGCSSAEELELHQLSHVGQAQLQCPLSPCQRRFTTSSALQNHLFSHFPGPTCQNLRPEGLLDPTAPQPEEDVEAETTVAVLPLWEVYPTDPPPAGP
ncbi:hypothetical protein SKAU_G00223610 [Synaphobranchus kaupii]|uniref:C2H2-type domain-containing protein n=1 Tax=Synaphobranchus kaupii TaxID=118154 RepID=A0A9Q1FBL2_SYNKA|nr:hypothetical protein SKAU_G00223610 [Synaphobranchus kaupii]